MHTYRAHVTSVYDGDTCRVSIDMGFNHWVHDMPIRWYGINTPEMTGADKVRGAVVRDQVRELILCKDVYIQTEKAGKFGRWLGTFWLVEDWELCREHLGHDNVPFEASINQWLVDQGFAVEFMKEG